MQHGTLDAFARDRRRRWRGRFQHLPDDASQLIDRARRAVAQVDLAHLTRGLTLDAIHGDPPVDERDFDEYARRTLVAPDGRDTSLDPWGESYGMERRDGYMLLRSNGPDGVRGTDDDVVHIAPTFRLQTLFFD